MNALLKEKDGTIFHIIESSKASFRRRSHNVNIKFLEQRYSLPQSGFPKKINVFAKGLDNCLSSGVFAIENKILDDIYSANGTFRNFGNEINPEGYNFASQIRLAIQRE